MLDSSKDTGQYDDIINLKHHTSLTHQHMKISDRAAQFSPFAALTGFDSAISETARLTNQKIELSESDADILNAKLLILKKQINSSPEITVTYFKSDNKKTGGDYISVSGAAKKIDEYKQILQLHDETKIPISDIIKLDGEIFSGSEDSFQ